MRRLGELEAVVMDRLWSWGRPVVVREVLKELQGDRAIAYTTVMTVLNNLHRKGFVIREKQGRAYRYRTAQTRQQHTTSLMEHVLAGSGDREAALLHFVEQMPVEEIARLREALESFTPDSEANPG